MTWTVRQPIDRLPAAAGVATDQLFLDANGRAGLGTDARNQTEAFYFARSVGKETPTLLAGADKAEENRKRLKALLDAIGTSGRGYVQLPKGDWYTNGPVAVRSGTTVVGQGPATRMCSTYVEGAGDYFAGQIFWTGSYHTNNFASYTKDTIVSPQQGDDTITRITTTEPIVADDVVVIYSSDVDVDKRLRRVVSVSGTTVVLNKPLNPWGGDHAHLLHLPWQRRLGDDRPRHRPWRCLRHPQLPGPAHRHR